MKMKVNRLLLVTAILVTVVPALIGGCKADKQQSPTQPSLPGADFPVAAAFACFVFVDQPRVIGFEDRSSGAPNQFAWDFGDGGRSTEKDPRHSYGKGGKYLVTLTARDNQSSDTVSQFAVTDVGCTTATCGDGNVDFDEQCDDGNAMSGDGCSSSCRTEFCGDGIVQVQAGEQCDDGNVIPNDGCSSDCKRESCGDGVVQSREECDDGNRVSGDGCTQSCDAEFCGDGVIQTALGEACDDGNVVSGDGCEADCTVTTAP